jgi:hypothetical protein
LFLFVVWTWWKFKYTWLFFLSFFFRYKLNVWDVGGQKSLRSYWRNYFESTDGLIWVVDSADKRRLDDCRKELHALLKEEVSYSFKQIMQFKIITENICYYCGPNFKRSLIGNLFTLFKYSTDTSPKHLLMTKGILVPLYQLLFLNSLNFC